MTKKSIALVTSSFAPHLGGVENFVQRLALGLKAKGFSVIVITHRWPRDLAEFSMVDSLPVYRIAFPTPFGGWRAQIKFWMGEKKSLNKMEEIFQKHSCHLVNIHCLGSNAYYATKAAQNLGLPVVASAHGELTADANQIFHRSAFFKQSLKDTLENAQAVTAPSRQSFDDLRQFNRKDFSPVSKVIYGGVDAVLGVKAYQHPKPYILAVARLVKIKGIDVLIDAFPRALQKGLQDTDLLIVGDGPEAQNLKHQVQKLGLSSQVLFMGEISDRKKLFEIFKGCSFFVLPSREESLGLVILEAMSVAKAVIASRVGGIPEILENERTGLLVKADDPMALAQALTNLSHSEPRRIEMGLQGAMVANNFDWQKTIDQFEVLYDLVLARP